MNFAASRLRVSPSDQGQNTKAPDQADLVTGSARSGDRISPTRSGPGPADTVHLYGETVIHTLPHCSGAGERVGFDEFIQEMQADGRNQRGSDASSIRSPEGLAIEASGTTVSDEVGGAMSDGTVSGESHAKTRSREGTKDQGPMTKDSGSRPPSQDSRLVTDPELTRVLEIYGVHSPAGTIRAALAAGHTEATLRARIDWLNSQLVEVPFSERGSCTVDNAPSWKFPYAPQKVHACLSKPENVSGSPELGWGSVCGVWASYFKEAAELIQPELGKLSPLRWQYADGEKGRKTYAPNGGTGDEKPKTKKRPVADGTGQMARSDQPKEAHTKSQRLESQQPAMELLSTTEGREKLAALVAEQMPGGSRLREKILAGDQSPSVLMACRFVSRESGVESR